MKPWLLSFTRTKKKKKKKEKKAYLPIQVELEE